MNHIKNIIFDWGGVITSIDFSATINAFKQYGINDFENYYSQTVQSELFVLHETGMISPEEFRSKLKCKIPAPITDEELDTAWMAMLGDTPRENINLLKRLKKRYRIFLLSNTNSIHVERYNQLLEHKFSFKDGLSGLFEEVYYSHEVGFKKPDTRIFSLLLEENQLIANETLFIDDTLQNIVSAAKLGMRTIHLKDGISLDSIFGGNGELFL
ncbi:MAG TPA: HAD family phosphatase [Sunxiuqinia sp.]|nr:HAD family phosphatase [Sunxiuqinia sp.]